MSIAEKFQKSWYQLLSIIVDTSFFAGWLIILHVGRWLFVAVGEYFGPKFALEGQETWLYSLAFNVVSWTTFIAVCIFLVTDLIQLVLAVLDDTCTMTGKFRAKWFPKS